MKRGPGARRCSIYSIGAPAAEYGVISPGRTKIETRFQLLRAVSEFIGYYSGRSGGTLKLVDDYVACI